MTRHTGTAGTPRLVARALPVAQWVLIGGLITASFALEGLGHVGLS